MTVGELKEALQEMDDDMEIRFASQPSWPFENEIASYAIVETKENPDGCVYLSEGGQIGYLPKEVCDELGW